MSKARERRAKRRARRKVKHDGRMRIISIATQVYEPGDDADDLREKITTVLEESESDTPILDKLLQILELIMPLLIRLLAGI